MQRFALVLLLTLSACGQASPPRAPAFAYRNPMDAMMVALGFDRAYGYAPCTYQVETAHGASYTANLPDVECLRFKPPERIEAVWHYTDKESWLVTPGELAAGADRPGQRRRWFRYIYLFGTGNVCGPPNRCEPGEYRIVFTGRRTLVDGGYGPRGDIQEVIAFETLRPIEFERLR